VELPAIMTVGLPVPGRDLYPAEISRGVCPLCTYIRVVLFACITRGANDSSVSFDEELVRKDVREKLNLLRDSNVELIIKDVSTVIYDPKRLWRWVEIVKELCLEQM